MSFLPQESPKLVTEGEGGAYYEWNGTIFPYLREAKTSAGKLILHPRGFALPHYADSNKIAYVIQGSDGIVSLTFPNSKEEKVVKIKKGVSIFIASGVVNWWFNAGNDDLKVIFLGEAYNNPGVFNYYLLPGPIGIIKSFPTEILKKAYKLTEQQVTELTNSQKELFITILEEGKVLTKPSSSDTNALTYDFEKNIPDIHVENGGLLSIITSDKYPPLQGVELSVKLIKLEPNATFGPTFLSGDSGAEITYVVKGSGKLQVVEVQGNMGKLAFDGQIKAGQLLAIPKYCASSIIANDEGFECFTIVTTSRLMFASLAGKDSIWKALAPQVIQYAFNISPELSKLFLDNINKTSVIVPQN